ncbi:hypothetical protein H1S01_11750 [Heliobacterium chlorum]|uniref:Uncharacterized protein n=1 Tax=Heliobacterium chlorum TaxID=2698 RepID=A0ABR7T5A2_HELCL|nr:hypothetical protein [Heliobacterium chlorum]MBC9785183.1 hypothetical protein [Heliobacterium chlorum]
MKGKYIDKHLGNAIVFTGFGLIAIILRFLTQLWFAHSKPTLVAINGYTMGIFMLLIAAVNFWIYYKQTKQNKKPAG